MNQTELRALVAQTVAEVLAEQQRPRRALVLFTGALLGFDDACDALERLRADGWDLNMVLTPSARHVLDPERLARLGLPELERDLVRDHQALLIPTLTCNIAAKAAHGIADCLASNLVHQFLLQGLPIVAARNGACPDHRDKRAWFPDIPPAFADRLRQNLQELAGFGVVLCDAAQLDQAARRADGNTPAPAPLQTVPCERRLVSQAVVAPLPDGCTLKIRPDALVTALATDWARSHGITIQRSPREGH